MDIVDLPDDLLTHVLSFLDVTEVARTSVLSRRWRTLWRQVNVINLDTGTYWEKDHYNGQLVGKLLFRDALATVYADGRCPVKKLSIEVDSTFQNDYLEDVMRTSPGMDALLAAPAMEQLEELHLVLFSEFCQTSNEYVLPASGLPWRCLRVLELQGCTLSPPGRVIFEHLETLEMVACNTSPDTLQAMLDAAPNLSSLWLQRVSLKSEGLGHQWLDVMSKIQVLLRCPKSLVHVTLMHCHMTDGLYLDAPNVRFLRYKGFLQHFPFNSKTSFGLPRNLQHAYLSFCTNCCYVFSRQIQPHGMFWETVGRFSRLRELKLKLKYIDDIAVYPDQEKRFLKLFPDLELLKVKGSYKVGNQDTAVAIANLFYCCPAMEEFLLKLRREESHAFRNHRIHHTAEWRAQLDTEKSMKSLNLLKSTTSPPYYDVRDHLCDGIDLSALEGHSFSCLDNRLRKIKLEIPFECFNCLGAKLHKFLVENAHLLEKVVVRDG